MEEWTAERREDREPLLPISALEHLLYCERQAALIHVCDLWADNGDTTAGTLGHQRVIEGPDERRPGLEILRSVPLVSRRLGISGISDVIEVRREGLRTVFTPVEYKRGTKRVRIHDDVQLAAQAMAIEEMMDTTIAAGAIFHLRSKRRRVVAIDERLRSITTDACARLRQLVVTRTVPDPPRDARCTKCSLEPLCLPTRSVGVGGLARAIGSLFERRDSGW